MILNRCNGQTPPSTPEKCCYLQKLNAPLNRHRDFKVLKNDKKVLTHNIAENCKIQMTNPFSIKQQNYFSVKNS